MPKREAPSEPSPEPYVPSVTMGVTVDACLLCGDEVDPWPAAWCELFGPEERQTGFVHIACIDAYQSFAAQAPFASALVTSLF